jgi:hypothetical protein
MGLTLGQSAQWIRMFIIKITDKFILGLDILQAYDVMLDMKHNVLWLGKQQVLSEHPEVQLQSSRTLANHEMILAQCNKCGDCMVRGPSGGSKWPNGIKFEELSSRKTVQSQDVGSSWIWGTYQNQECDQRRQVWLRAQLFSSWEPLMWAA